MKVPLKTEFEINGYEIRLMVTDERWKQNCYLVTHKLSGEQVLIDPGSKEDLLIKTVQENGLGKPKHILLTHAHFDHIGAAFTLSNRFKLPCIVHKSDFRLLRQATMYALRFGGELFPIPDNIITFNKQPDIKIGDNKIKTLFTLGHTKGGVTYVFDGFVFTGDTLLYGRVGRLDLPGSDPSAMKKSVDLLLDNLLDETMIFGGHGRHWNISEASIWWKDAKTSLPQHNMFIH